MDQSNQLVIVTASRPELLHKKMMQISTKYHLFQWQVFQVPSRKATDWIAFMQTGMKI